MKQIVFLALESRFEKFRLRFEPCNCGGACSATRVHIIAEGFTFYTAINCNGDLEAVRATVISDMDCGYLGAYS